MTVFEMRSRLRRVVAAGTFDGLHAGHRHYLRTARSFGDHLTVIVARDSTIPVVKGKHPRQSERRRRAAVASLPDVDRAVLGLRVRSNKPEERFRVLLRLRPDVICLGYDQPVDRSALRRYLHRHGMSSTRVVRVGKMRLRDSPRAFAAASRRPRKRSGA